MLALRMRILVTGGCGFIGSNFVRFALEQPTGIRSRTSMRSLTREIRKSAGVPERYGDRYEFFQADIADRKAMGDYSVQGTSSTRS